MKKWMVFSSSSGQTFKKIFSRLSVQTQENCIGFFVDRECQARKVGEGLLGKDRTYCFSKDAFEEKALKTIQKLGIDDGLIFLCGYFGILSADFIAQVGLPIVNTHPSLLPAYPGLDKKVNRLAFENNPLSGVTLHMVTEELDGGPILFQHVVDISRAKTKEESRLLVRDLEQRHLPADLECLLKSSLKSEHRKNTFREIAALLKKGPPA